MSNKTTSSGNPRKQPFDKNHPYHPDYRGDNPKGVLLDDKADETHRASTADEQHEQNQQAEQQLKQQQHEQDERSAFQKGNAQEHQQGNRQK